MGRIEAVYEQKRGGQKDRKNVTGAFFLLEEGYTTVNHDSLHNEFRLERHERAGSFDFVTHSRSS